MSTVITQVDGAGAINGTTDDDIIVAQHATGAGVASPQVLTGGDGNDVIFGDHNELFVDDGTTTNNSLATAIDIGSDLDKWSTRENPNVGDATTIPYTSVLVTGDGQPDVFEISVDAGETITVDLDYGRTSNGNGSFDSFVELIDPLGFSLASNDDSVPSTEGLGSITSPARDSFLTFENTTGTAQTYFIRVGDLFGGGVGIGDTYMLNVSVTNHAVTNTSVFGDDDISGGAGDDILYGVGGADILRGQGGADTLLGGSGDDILELGDAATDLVAGDSFDGGDGYDTLAGSITTGARVYDVRSSTVINLERVAFSTDAASAGDLTFQFETGQFQAAGFVEVGVDARDGADAFQIELTMADTSIYDLSGLSLTGGFGSVAGDGFTVLGDETAETIIGSTISDVVDLGAATDVYAVRGGLDDIDLGADVDLLIIDDSTGALTVGASYDGGAGTSDVLGIDASGVTFLHDVTLINFETLQLLPSADVSRTIQMTDAQVLEFTQVQGNSSENGQDTIEITISAAGDFDLSGLSFSGWGIGLGTQDDLIRFIDTRVAGGSTITGTSQNDEFNANGGDNYVGGAGTDTITYDALTTGANASLRTGVGFDGAVGDTYAGIENLRGSSFNDTLEGDNEANILDGGAGTDSTTYFFDTAALDADLASGLVISGGGQATGDTFINIENLTGTNAFADNLKGSGANNVLNGGGGDDVLAGRGGDDMLDGGDGNDTVSYADAGGRVAVFLNRAPADVGSGEGIDTFISIENVTGSDFDDRLVGDAGDNILTGGNGDDVLIGLAGNDTLRGGEGNDELTGSGGEDRLEGGFGVDELYGLGGADALFGGGGDDDIFAGLGVDVVNGNAGNDLIFGNFGQDTIFGGLDDDDIRAGGSGDVVEGGQGADKIVGGNGKDILWGGSENDILTGGNGDGSGDGLRDVFVFKSSDNDGGGFDRIRDFEDTTDKLDLSESGYTNFADVFADATQVGAHVQINFDFSGIVQIEDFLLADLTAGDFIF
ncbi:MAG: calcium-binding protein [Aliishimia sp.]